MKRLRFKRGIRINLAKDEKVVIPNGEYWKVMFVGYISAYGNNGAKSEDGLNNYSDKHDTASSIRTILPSGTLIKNSSATDSYTSGLIIGVAFEEVEYV